MPTTVGINKLAGYQVWARNDDSSTISQFFLNSASIANAYGATWYNSSSPTVVSPCAIKSNQLACAFGQVKPGETIFVTAAFTAPATATVDTSSNCIPGDGTGVIEGVAPLADGSTFFCVELGWNTTGSPPGKNKSHGDGWNWFDFTLTSNNPDYNGQFAFDTSHLTIANNSASRSNPRSTAIDATNTATTGIGLTVADGNGVTPPAVQTGDNCTTADGQWSALNVGDNRVFPAGKAFKVTIVIYQGPNPTQVTGICHIYLDTATGLITGSTITTQCDTNVPPSTVPCFTATKAGNNTQLVIWLLHNGHAGWT